MSVIVAINFARKWTSPQWVEIIVDTVRASCSVSVVWNLLLLVGERSRFSSNVI